MSIQKRENPVQGDILEIELADLDKIMNEDPSDNADDLLEELPDNEEKTPKETSPEEQPPQAEPEEDKPDASSSNRLPGKITKKFSGQLVEKILEGMVTESYIKEASATELDEGIYLINKKTGQAFELKKEYVMLIGSDPSKASIVIEGNNTVSRSHAEISVSASGEVYIKDVGSRNGTEINGISINDGGVYQLASEDEIRFSNEPFVIKIGG